MNSSSSSSSSSKSSSRSSSSSPSPFSPSTNLHHQVPKPNKTMEEVWKDINLSSLHDHPPEQDLSSGTPPPLHHHHHHHHHHNPNFILQDFLSRPFNKDPPPRIVSGGRGDSRGRLYPSSVPPPPPPPTVLSLNPGPTSFGFVHNSDALGTCSHWQSHHYPVSNISSLNCPFEDLDSSPGLPSFGKKRIQDSDGDSGDRRYKRMIKNRESAARSRARKQAYTNELELEVAHLLEENTRLRRQQEELEMAAAVQLPKKHTLHRTSTAPF